MDNYICLDCGDIQEREYDCLKHAEKYGHFEFKDEEGEIFNPLKDDRLE